MVRAGKQDRGDPFLEGGGVGLRSAQAKPARVDGKYVVYMEYESISSGLDAVTCLCLCTGRRRPVGGSGLKHTGVERDLLRHTGASNGQRLVRGYLARRFDSREKET